MKTPCLECAHLAPLKRIAPGDPLEIQVGQQGHLARGLALCKFCLPGQHHQRYRYIHATSPCPNFERVYDKEKIANRWAIANRLQAAYAAWFEGLKQRRN